MTDIALFRLPDGRAWLGQGPFQSFATAPAEGGAFYINDFNLSDPEPWKKPVSLQEVDAAGIVALISDAAGESQGTPTISWAKPATEWFKMAFRRIRREVLSGRLEKMVPVLTEKGSIVAGNPIRLLANIMAAPENTWGYARIQGDQGFLGATPELLFRATGTEVDTMALAGTAKPGNQDAFLTDVKEIEEHEIVVRYLSDRLSTLGQVERQPRGLCHASGLLHFQTQLHARLSSAQDAGQLVEELHPTPAVGCLPRTEQWLTKLREYRTQLGVPLFFGAPFGFAEPTQEGNEATTCHMVVSIRGMSWTGNEVQLASGCGIIAGSAFDHEWRELRLKREAVLNMLGLQSH